MEVQITPKGYAYGQDYTADHIILVYTTDGTEPTPFSPRYDGPIAVDTTTTLRVGCISPYGTMVKRDYTYLYPVDVRNMADYRALPDNTFARLQLDDAVVTYSEITAGKGGDWYQYIYLRDSTGPSVPRATAACRCIRATCLAAAWCCTAGATAVGA